MTKARFEVVLRRRNGRFVRRFPAKSSYAAKRIQDRLEDKYDNGYYVEIRPAGKAGSKQ